jgi:ribulose-phosphate 3-epimerase
MKIAPSILSADFARLGAQLQELEAAGADQIHIDVMDGRFVPQISFGLPIVKAVRRVTSLPLDVHLMIVEPEKHIPAFADAGADMITIHYEATAHVHGGLQHIRRLGLRAGIALNPHTPAILLTEIMGLVDMILVLTVNPGAGGQHLLPETLPKIQHLRQMIRDHQDIIVDGGINPETAPLVCAAGANILVAGTSVFGDSSGIRASIHALRQPV